MSKRESRLLQILRDASPAQQVLRAPAVDLGLKEGEPFPFLAIIGQQEMKLALLLAIINPRVGGVLLIGSRGTAKTTAVRALTDVLPVVDKKAMHLTELPLNARLEDVVGGISERSAIEKQQVRLEKGILAQADNNVLYIDEVNLLDGDVMDAILDASAQGFYTVRRGANNLTYSSRFVLIGSMNPEEGRLRPQIMDRFGLRAIVRGLSDAELRYQAYELALWHRRDSESLSVAYEEETLALAQEIQLAVDRLPDVVITAEAKRLGLSLIHAAGIESNRAEITLFEAARAHAASEERTETLPQDIRAVALLALRQRQSKELDRFFKEQNSEDSRLQKMLASVERSLSGEEA